MITGTSNPQIKYLQKLLSKAKQRKTDGVFVAEGIRMIREVPGERLVAVYCSESFAAEPGHGEWMEKLQPLMVSDAVFQHISDTVTPQGILAVVRMAGWTVGDIARSGRPVLILESLQDPGNLGTILRSGEGAGIGGVIMNTGTADVYSPKVVRSTMGSVLRVPFAVTEDLASAVRQLKEENYRVYAAHLKGELSYTDEKYGPRTAFLIGNEGNGLTRTTAELADSYIRIPMEGAVESLNAGVAASLLVYEVYRQNRPRSEGS